MRQRAVLHDPSQFVTAIAYGPDGKSLFTDDFHGDDGVRSWDVATGQELEKLFGVQGPGGVGCLALSPDGKILASTGHDWGGTVQLWDIAARKRSALLASGEPEHRILIRNMAYCPDGKALATLGGEDCRLRLWDVVSGKLLRCFGEPPDFYSTSSLAVSSDGKTIVTAGGVGGATSSPGEVRLWDAATGQSLRRYQAHARPISCVAFSPDGSTLATGSRDENESIILWHFDGSQLSRKLPLTRRAAFR
jgi:WD40 repeat protein